MNIHIERTKFYIRNLIRLSYSKLLNLLSRFLIKRQHKLLDKVKYFNNYTEQITIKVANIHTIIEKDLNNMNEIERQFKYQYNHEK